MIQHDRVPGPLRLGVLLSGGGRTLLNLLAEIQQGLLAAEVAVVVASRPCKGADRAADRGLPVVHVPYRQIGDVGAYSRRIVGALDEARVDLVIQAGFLSLWHIPQRYAGRVMNIHPALLPAFGGKGMFGQHVHEAVLASGAAVSGCTVHLATDEYDRGPIILQRVVPVLPGDSADDLAERVFAQECIAYPLAIRLYGQGRLSADGGRVRILPPGQ
jgi:formyltetrahydrofolate-dependent phosphoribosylglycinamide formyltransferase